ncbi:MAG TPA: guanine deaminase [Trueperaceae bacterium]
MPVKLFRAQLFHTPRNPFEAEDALEVLSDGCVAVAGGVVEAVGDFVAVSGRYPDAETVDGRGGMLVPGFVDTHVHYPQLPVMGAMGLHLLDWLEQRTLPEEARFASEPYARERARAFLAALARNGTTSALVFGAHFAGAMQVFFEEAEASKLRITSGLVVSDRELRADMHTDPETAYQQSRELALRWHGRGRLRYAITPRFSLSCSDDLLAACGILARELPDLFVTSHLNETIEEIRAVAEHFPRALDYLATYERHDLVHGRSLFAHNVHPTESELERLAAAGSKVCHCPSSNAFIGSGLFPMRGHLEKGVEFALGTDVGAGTGPSLLREGLAAYNAQMMHERGVTLGPEHLLYLATAGGARALDLPQVGWFAPGMEFDAVLLRPPAGGTLVEVLRHVPSAHAALAATFTLGGEDCVNQVYVAGQALLGD